MVHVSDAGGRHKMLAFSTEPNINIDTIVNIKDILNSSSSSSSSGNSTPTVENYTANIQSAFPPKEQYNLGIIKEEPSLIKNLVKNSSSTEIMITDEDGSNGNVNFNDSLNSNSTTNMNIDDGFDLISASGSETMQLLDNESNASGASCNRVFTEEIVIVSSSKMSPNGTTKPASSETKVVSQVSNKKLSLLNNTHDQNSDQQWEEKLEEQENVSHHTNELEETPLLTEENTSTTTNVSTTTTTSSITRRNKVTTTNSATSTTDNISNDSSNVSPITKNAVSSVGINSNLGTPTNSVAAPKHGKLTNGTKHTGLKRVSFGSSKGSMVETLIYESPVSEEREIVKKTGNGTILANGAARAVSIDGNDSQNSTISGGSTGGSRPPSRVRVTFFESEKPLAVSSPESDILDLDLSNMTLPGSPSTVDRTTPSYNRQMSAESGWDNPFRPDGDLSKEADQIVELIKEGKPINDETLRSKSPSVNETMNSITLTNNQLNASPKGKGANGSTSNGGGAGPVEVQHGVVAPAAQAGQVEHIVLKKKKGCCVIQ